MQLLLDTHALLWWLSESPRLRATWRRVIAAPETRVVLSAVSIWEIAIKAAMGRLSLDLPEGLRLEGLAAACGFEDLPVLARHAAAVQQLPLHHCDPFDRLLVTQAQLEQLTLVSADRSLAAYEVDLLQ